MTHKTVKISLGFSVIHLLLYWG